MSDLTGLVARTEGAQPWRKVFHAVNALLIVAAISLVRPTYAWMLLVLGSMAATLLAVDLARLADERANALFFRAFRRLASPREMKGIASSTWYAFGILLTAALFDRAAAVSGILVLGLADPSAGYVGRRWGTRPWLGGTLEGSLVFLGTCAVIVGLRHGWGIALPVGALVTLAERRSWPLDDNFTIPLVCAGAIALLGAVA
jgi:dolichol kinase